MKQLSAAAVLAVALLAVPAEARASGKIIDFQGGFKCIGFNFGIGKGTPVQVQPWYLYYPLEAQFQTPAPTPFPYWPAPMGAYTSGPPIQPACHHCGGHFSYPGFWYGH